MQGDIWRFLVTPLYRYKSPWLTCAAPQIPVSTRLISLRATTSRYQEATQLADLSLSINDAGLTRTNCLYCRLFGFLRTRNKTKVFDFGTAITATSNSKHVQNTLISIHLVSFNLSYNISLCFPTGNPGHPPRQSLISRSRRARKSVKTSRYRDLDRQHHDLEVHDR